MKPGDLTIDIEHHGSDHQVIKAYDGVGFNSRKDRIVMDVWPFNTPERAQKWFKKTRAIIKNEYNVYCEESK